MKLRELFDIKKPGFWAWIATVLVLLESIHITFTERYIVDSATGQMWQPSYYNARLFLIFVMAIAVIALLFTLQVNSEGESRDRKIYWSTVLLITIAIFIRYPQDTWQAEPYWETSTNILWQTYNRGPLKSLILDDSGYWTLLPRIMAIIIMFVFRQVRYAPIILQFSCTMLFVFICAKIVKKEFSKSLPVENRFVIALLLGTTGFLPIHEIIVGHNIGYVGGILLIMCCFMDMDKISLPTLTLDASIIMLSCCSKLHMLVFFPIVVALLIFFHKRMHRYMKVLLACTLVGNIMMVLYYVSGIAEASGFALSKEIITILLTSVFEYLQTWLFLAKPYLNGGYYAGWIYNLSITVFLMSVLVLSLKYKSKRTIALWCLNAVMIGNIMVNVLAGRMTYTVTGFKDFLLATSVDNGRNMVLTFAAMLFLVFFVLLSDDYFFRKTIYKEAVVLGLSLMLMMRFLLVQETKLNTYNMLNWKEYSQCFQNDSYGIPAGAEDLFLLKNAQVKYWGNRDILAMNGHFASGVSKVNKIDQVAVEQLVLDEENTIVSIYAQKNSLFNSGMPRAMLFDKDNKLVETIDGIANKDRYAVGFICKEPIEGVEHILFTTEKGNPYPMKSDIFVVVEAPGRGLAGDAGWGQSSLEE